MSQTNSFKKMNRQFSTSTSSLIKDDDNSSRKEDEDEEINGFLKSRKAKPNNINDDDDELDDLNTRITCMTFYSRKRHSSKGKHSGRHEQKDREALVSKKVKGKSSLENLIDKQFKRYKQAMIPRKLEDFTQMLAPPPLEMVAVGWLGDWRPSAILELLRSLARSSFLSSSLSDSSDSERMLSQLIHEIRIEEAVIDEEMAEIQATCILHLPFRPNLVTTSSMGPKDRVQSQLQKIKQVTTKAQQLRCKVLDLVMKKVLSQVDAEEFLVAFIGIQDAIHQFAARHKLQKGPVHVSAKALATV